MKKLFALVALVGMGAFIAGCAEEKPAAKPTTPSGGAGGVATPGPKAGGAADKTGDKEGDMPADGDKATGDKPADEGDKPADEGDKPSDEGDKPSEEDKPSE